MTVERVAELAKDIAGDDKDLRRLFDWSLGRVGVYPSSDFIPNGAATGEFRNKYLCVQGVVNKVLMGWYRKGNGILIQTRVLEDWLEREGAPGRPPSFHFSPLHWTHKPGKAEGRVICNCSAATEGQMPLKKTGEKSFYPRCKNI